MTNEKNINLLDFHKIGKSGNPYDIIDDKIASYIVSHENIIIISGKPYIYKNGVYVKDDNGNILRYLIKSMIIQELITISRINRVYALITTNHKLEVDASEVNNYPSHWINFKNGMLDVITGEMHSHSPSYLSINQIPHRYIENLNYDNSVFKRFVESRITDKDTLEMLYEFMGYCMTKDITFQKFMILYGLGDAGKSTIIKMLTYIIGKNNSCSIALQNLCDRFTTSSLLFKMLNTCGDIPSSALKDTSVIKQLTGDDDIKAEYKGGEVFFFRNHAKMLFSCNELPVVLDEKSNGFYRRLLIVRFDKKGEYIQDLNNKIFQESEAEIVISHLINYLKNALSRGKLFESGDSLKEIKALRHDSDTVSAFLEDWGVESKEKRILRVNLYNYYEEYCREESRTPLGKTTFFKSMRAKQFIEKKIQGEYYFYGIDVEFHHTVFTPFSN